MGKFIDLGFRKPRAGSTQNGWTVSFGGLLKGYHVQVVGDHRDIENFMNTAGHALQQTEVVGTAHSEAGNGYAFDILQQDGKELDTDAGRGRLYSDLRDQLGPSSEIVPGFQPIERDGRPGIRIVKLYGPMSDDDVNELKAAAARVLESRNYTVSGEHGPIDIIRTGNDWRENPGGQYYTARLAQAGRSDLAEWLDGELGRSVRERISAEADSQESATTGEGLRPGDILYQGQEASSQEPETTGEKTQMGKVTHHGLRKPDDPIFQSGSTTVSIGGLVKPKQQAERPSDWPEWKTEEFPPSGYRPHPKDDTFYPPNPKDRKKLPQ